MAVSRPFKEDRPALPLSTPLVLSRKIVQCFLFSRLSSFQGRSSSASSFHASRPFKEDRPVLPLSTPLVLSRKIVQCFLFPRFLFPRLSPFQGRSSSRFLFPRLSSFQGRSSIASSFHASRPFKEDRQVLPLSTPLVLSRKIVKCFLFPRLSSFQGRSSSASSFHASRLFKEDRQVLPISTPLVLSRKIVHALPLSTPLALSRKIVHRFLFPRLSSFQGRSSIEDERRGKRKHWTIFLERDERREKRKHWTIFLERTRGVERGSAGRSSLKGRETAIVRSDEHWNCFKGNVWETSERRGGAHHCGLFRAHRYYVELN